LEGIVKFFSEKKGWGFIKADDGSDLFFHFSSIQKAGYKSVFEDQKVSFEEGENEKGKCAINVKVLDE